MNRARFSARARHGPRLDPHQLWNPCTYVTDADLRALPGGLVDRHRAELEQWRLADELSPTALALVALLLPFRGLRHGLDGCGVQATVAELSRLTGRSERMVQYALDELQAGGWIRRRRRFVKVDWVDARGVEHAQADVVWATYLTLYGARRLERRGETRRFRVVAGRGRVQVLHACGVVGSLFEALTQILRTLARRCASIPDSCTPSFGEQQDQESSNTAVGNSSVESASRTGSQRATSPPSAADEPSALRPPPPPPSGRAGGLIRREANHAAAAAFVAEELERLWSRRALTPATAWPDLWRRADERQRKWLEQRFRPYRAVLAARIRAAAQEGT